jgi:hypothetical protein
MFSPSVLVLHANSATTSHLGWLSSTDQSPDVSAPTSDLPKYQIGQSESLRPLQFVLPKDIEHLEPNPPSFESDDRSAMNADSTLMDRRILHFLRPSSDFAAYRILSPARLLEFLSFSSAGFNSSVFVRVQAGGAQVEGPFWGPIRSSRSPSVIQW